MKSSKIILGTANLFNPYGMFRANNSRLQNDFHKILSLAAEYECFKIDTAVNYGDLSPLIRNFESTRNFHVINKIQPDIENIDKLNFEITNTVLLHVDPLNRSAKGVHENIILTLREKMPGIKLGVSIYNADDIDAEVFDLCDVVQLPLSVLDRSLLDCGLIAHLKSKKIQIHVRSIFLQGLLLNEHKILKGRSANLTDAIQKFQEYCKEKRVSYIAACIGFVLNNDLVDGMVCGYNSLKDIKQIFELERKPKVNLDDMPSFQLSDESSLKPYNW